MVWVTGEISVLKGSGRRRVDAPLLNAKMEMVRLRRDFRRMKIC